MSEDIDFRRRNFLGIAAATFAAARFDAAAAQSKAKPPLPAIKPGTNTSFAPLKQIDAGLLNIGYAEAGPADGPPVILLHGWPYDIYSFVDVTPLLAQAAFASSYLTCAVMARRASCRMTPSATASPRRSPPTSSR